MPPPVAIAAASPTAAARTSEIVQAGEQRSSRVESLRALAALGVLVGHTFIMALAYQGTSTGLWHRTVSGGLLAVFLFFTLSGYLLYWPFVQRDFGDGRALDLRRYARNRALRILPLYFTAVAVLMVLDPLGVHRSDWWRFALFIENYSARTIERLDSPMWTLSVEMQFYVLLPLIAWGTARLSRGSAGRALMVIGTLGATSFALRLDRVILRSPSVLSPLDGPLSLPTLFFFFSTGMAVALLRVAWERHPPRWLHGALGAPDLWLLASVPLWFLAALDPRREPLIAAGSFLLVAGCVLAQRRGRLVRALEWRPLAAVGVASYSLYLWHVPLLLHLSGTRLVFPPGQSSRDLTPPQSFGALFVLSLPVCLAVAAASYKVIEVPFLRLRRRWT